MFPAIEIFKTGTHTPMQGEAITFTAADLRAVAAGYDPAKHEAPVVVGHPATDAPAYGWVKGLRFDGDRLLAELDQVDPAFAEMVKAGRFKHRSPSFYLPGAAKNPTPGQLYLRHVGFLGAAAPAVAGLKPISFADAEDGVVDFSRQIEEPNDVTTQQQQSAEFAAREAKLREDEAKLAERQKQIDAQTAEFAERDRKARRDADEAFLKGLVKEGRLAPGWVAGLVSFMQAIDGAETVQFAEGDGDAGGKKTERDFLRAFLKGQPVQIDLAERGNGELPEHAASFAAPPGYTVDADRAALHAKAVAYQAAHPNTDYIAAVKAVGGK